MPGMCGGRRWAGLIAMLLVFGSAPRCACGLAPEQGAGAGDSLSVTDVLTPEDVREEAIDNPTEVETAEHSRRSSGTIPVAGDVGLTYGPRTEFACRLRFVETLQVGFRARDADRVGYFSWKGRRWIRNIVVGNMGLRMGERIILGRGFVDYSLNTTRGRAVGIHAYPSLSRYSGRPGVAVEVGGEHLSLQSIVVSEKARLRPSPGALWLSAASSFGEMTVGIAVGRRLGIPTSAAETLVVALSGSYVGDVFKASGEWVTLSAKRFFAMTVWRKGSLAWFARVYRIPVFATGAVPSSDPATHGSWQQGVTAALSGRPLAVKTRVVIVLGSRRSVETRRLFRRAYITVGGKSGIVTWETTVSALSSTSMRTADAPDVQFILPVEVRQLRGRLKLGVQGDASLSQNVTIEQRVGRGWRTDGLVLIVAGRWRGKRIDVRWQTAGYSLVPGQGTLIARPGVGSFELFTSAYGRGSDTSVRIRLKLTRGLFVAVYAGEPWKREKRFYVNASLVLP